jgi:hypothetical protein
MKLFLAIILVPIVVFPAAAVEVALSGGVDTADDTVNAVLELWNGYLDARPDLMWRDAEWNGEKSRFWRDFDLTAPFVYQFNLDSLPPGQKPVVLSIEREGELYSIRTLFFRVLSGEEPVPWAIVRVYAQFEEGNWKLRNALGVHTAHWNRPAIGRITFVTPPGHQIDIALARRSLAYCDSLSAANGAPGWDPFQFYIARSREEADRIIGLEYHYDGPPDGRVLRYHDVAITGTSREWAPRELSGMISPAQR